MKILERVCTFVALVAAVAAPVTPSVAAPLIQTQEPCFTADGYCLYFAAVDPIPIVRSVSFNAPSAGTAAVKFHGSLICNNDFFRPAVSDVVSQIVTDAATVPDVNGPGGLRHAIVFTAGPDPFFGGMDKADTFNLNSTRVVSIAGPGVQQFHFKIARLRMDGGTFCYVYNAAFTIVFVP
jgi:hypothetical protein